MLLLSAVALAQTPSVEPVSATVLRQRVFAPSDRPRLVNFWATWCGPCVEELPRLTAYAKAHPEVEVVMVDLDLPKLRTSKVEPFLARHGVTGITQLLLDESDPAAAMPKLVPSWSDIVPVTLVVSEQGVVTKQLNGALSQATLEGLP